MRIRSLQYAKVNKVRKTQRDVHTEDDLGEKIKSVQHVSKSEDFDIDINKLDCKDLTLEEILSLETDQEVRHF